VVTNSGPLTATLGTLSISGNNPTDFSQTNNCPATLGVGASCTFTVTFTPGALGVRNASLAIPSNLANSPLIVALSGGAALSLGASTSSLYLTDQSPSTVTLSNLGTAPITFTSISVSAGLTETNTCGSSLGVGSGCTVTVGYPLTYPYTPFTGTLTITDNASNPTTSIPVLVSFYEDEDFGSTPVGTASVVTYTYYSTFDAAIHGWNIASGTISGADPGDFFFVGPSYCMNTTGGTCTISVGFNPTATGVRAAILKLNPGEGADGQTAYVLSGTGTP
jgi:hypothetical protein